ncbi:class I SAM-dependent methyltransferase [Microtetraspora niveoalba]|uniref:class I SAM-dependent methyltransferase n=1 Tax=Microtetraspora niveoalba TaxID=46175 RepID=UPI00083668E5|nr:class I SAM-dependent methyltransferase [Microtetraspora niveoalba]
MTDVRSPSAGQDDVFSKKIREQWTEQLGRRLDILVAGCGRASTSIFGDGDMERLGSKVSGIDEELPELRAHAKSRKDLDSWTLGDLRHVPIPPRSYDVILVDFLLERIRNAELVMDRMAAGLRPGGLLLIRLRDRSSAYGFCDRKTPAWLRRRLWKRFVPAETIGPLPAVYERISSREGIQAYCLMRGLMITEDYAGTSGAACRGPRAALARKVCRIVDRLSSGRLPSGHDEVIVVVRKPQNHFARLI